QLIQLVTIASHAVFRFHTRPELFLLPFFLLLIPPPPRSTLFPYTTPSDLLAGLWEQVFQLCFEDRHARVLSQERDPILAILDNLDRKSTRLNSSHVAISYAVFCLKKKRHSRWPGIHHVPRHPWLQHHIPRT